MSIGKASYRQSGFTLIEVLVAMVIFSLVMTLSVTSYRFSLINLSKDNKQKNIAQLTHIKLINKQIRSLKPLFFSLKNGESVPFFYGAEDGFSFVTQNPIEIDTPMAIAKVIIVGDQVQYCEVAFGSIDLSLFTHRDLECGQSIVYLSADNIEFSYFGWKDQLELNNFYSEYLNINVKPKPSWSTRFFADKRKLMPLFIKINMKDNSPFLLKIPEVTPFQNGAVSAFEG